MSGLSNEDFRRMLATPRPGQTPRMEDGAREKRKKPKPHKPKPAGKDAQGEDGPKYRDRAGERRLGLAADDDGIPPDLAGLLHGAAGADLSKVSYEESKYLGGDVAHTHLVKGLDFALLQKVRSEAETAGGPGDGAAAAPKPALFQRQEAPQFKTALGHAVHEFFFGGRSAARRAEASELFAPRRTAFVYELEDPAAPEVPTTLWRAREDCPKLPDSVVAALDGAVLDRLAKVLAYTALAGGGRKKLKRKEKAALLAAHGLQMAGSLRQPAPGGAAAAAEQAAPSAAARPPAPVDDDEDIFGGAGTDYVVEHKGMGGAAEGPLEGPARPGPRSYFGAGGEEGTEDLPPLPRDDGEAPPLPPEGGGVEGPARPPLGAGYGEPYAAYPEPEEAAAQGEEARVGSARPKPGVAQEGGTDAYEECYPAYFGYAGTVVDSEDEGEGGKEAGGGLGREDFNTEAEWREYQAAQTGAKGRKAQKEALKKEQRGRGKLSNQLRDIQQVFKDKGYEHHDAAFERPARKPKAERGAGGGFGGAGEEDMGPALTKKRRI